MEVNKDLIDKTYDQVVCALLHDSNACNGCKKCGEAATEARMNIIRNLAKIFDKELPWSE